MRVHETLTRLANQLDVRLSERAAGEFSSSKLRMPQVRPVEIVHQADLDGSSQRTATILVFDQPDESTYRQAAASGTVSVVDARCGVHTVVAVAMAASVGYHSVPMTIAPQLVTRLEIPPARLRPTEAQIEALRLLSVGGRVGNLAEVWGVSERHARRLANALWADFHASSPSQAVANAVRWGQLDAH